MLAEVYLGGIVCAGLSHLTFEKRKQARILREISYTFNKVVGFNLKEGVEQGYNYSGHILKEYGFDLYVSIGKGSLKDFRERFLVALECEYEGKIICNLTLTGIELKIWLRGMDIARDEEIEFIINRSLTAITNTVGEGFTVREIEKIVMEGRYIGDNILINIPEGLNFELLQKNKHMLERLGNSILTYDKDRNVANLRVLNDITLEYKPFEVKPYQMFVGYNDNFKRLIVDYSITANTLIAGMQNSGKTWSMIQGIMNTLNYNKNVDLYLACQDKPDLEIFKGLKQCKGYARNLKEVDKMLEELIKIKTERNRLMNPSEGIFNIYDYNEVADDKMNIMHFLCDEIADLMPVSEGDKLGKSILNKLLDLAKKGRSVGIYLTLATQSADANSIDPTLKRLLANKIIFKQVNEAGAKLMVGYEDNEKVKAIMNLNCKEREFYYETHDGSGVGRAYTTNTDNFKTTLGKLKQKSNSGRFAKIKKG